MVYSSDNCLQRLGATKDLVSQTIFEELHRKLLGIFFIIITKERVFICLFAFFFFRCRKRWRSFGNLTRRTRRRERGHWPSTPRSYDWSNRKPANSTCWPFRGRSLKRSKQETCGKMGWGGGGACLRVFMMAVLILANTIDPCLWRD